MLLELFLNHRFDYISNNFRIIYMNITKTILNEIISKSTFFDQMARVDIYLAAQKENPDVKLDRMIIYHLLYTI